MPDGHATAEKNNYTVSFHPAFASRCTVECADGTTHEVYRQSEPHRLNGQKHPQRHTIRLKGGQFDRDITLDVHDPKHHIKQIRVEMYGDRDPSTIGTGQSLATAEVFTTDTTAQTCPPNCEINPNG